MNQTLDQNFPNSTAQYGFIIRYTCCQVKWQYFNFTLADLIAFCFDGPI